MLLYHKFRKKENQKIKIVPGCNVMLLQSGIFHCRSPPLILIKKIIEIGGKKMGKVNLKDIYPDVYTEDEFIYVSDVIANVFNKSKLDISA